MSKTNIMPTVTITFIPSAELDAKTDFQVLLQHYSTFVHKGLATEGVGPRGSLPRTFVNTLGHPNSLYPKVTGNFEQSKASSLLSSCVISLKASVSHGLAKALALISLTICVVSLFCLFAVDFLSESSG